MLKKTITYVDYNGTQRTEDFYFNLSRAECIEMEISNFGMQEYIKKIVDSLDNKKIVEVFKEIILKAYGERSLDGKYFRKSKELAEAFSQTEAYTELYVELVTNTEAAIEFMNGIIPPAVEPQDHKKSEAKEG